MVGRPNVGKSTLFNRLVGKRLALVDPTPGLTRDRKEGMAHVDGLPFLVVDTPGFEHRDDNTLQAKMWDQAVYAIKQSVLVVFVIDGVEGITAQDRDIAAYLRTMGVPVLCCVSKADTKQAAATAMEAYALGFEGPVAVSAAHNRGMVSFYEAIAPYVASSSVAASLTRARADLGSAHEGDGDGEDQLPPSEDDPVSEDLTPEEGVTPERPLKLAVVGRPNVGKSSLINAIIDEERLLVGPEAGVTRDSIALGWRHKDTYFQLIDTAGLRKKARVQSRAEHLAGFQTQVSIDYAPLVLVVLDVTQALEKQDLTILHRVCEEGRCLIIGLNKWDLVPRNQQSVYLKAVQEQIDKAVPQLEGVPLVPLSAKTKYGLRQVFDTFIDLYAVWQKRISTATLNRWLESVLEQHQPPLVAGRRIKIRYMTQKKARPPTFLLFVNILEGFPEGYLRYLRRQLRYAFEMPGVPLRLILRKGSNPYDKRAR